MNKSSKNKKIYTALKTFGVIAVSTTTLMLSTGFAESTINNFSNNQTMRSDFSNKSLNEVTPDSLTNSEFYFSSFAFINPDTGDAGTTAKLVEAKQQWAAIKTNLETNFPQFSSIKSYKYIITKIADLVKWSDNLIVRESLRASGHIDLWETIKTTLDWKEFADVVGTQAELDGNIKMLSGFVSGPSDTHRIRTLNNKPAKVVDLVTGISTPVVLTGEYKTEITIAEIDLAATSEDIKLDFNFSNTSLTGMSARGSLIIRNANQQVTDSAITLADSQANLEIFGRWTNLGMNSITDPGNNFKGVMDNFVLSKSGGKLFIVVKLKDGDQISNVKVSGVPNFGIINSTLDSAVPTYPTEDTITNIKFFSKDLMVSGATASDVVGTTNQRINKKYEFYVGDNTEFNFNLFYQNSVDKVYKDLYGFEGDKISSTKKQLLALGVVAGSPASIAASKIQLSDEVMAEIGITDSDLNQLSVSLKTETSATKNIYKQGVYFNELMAFAVSGAPVPSRTGLVISLDSVLTQKIFFEDPGFVADAATKPNVSTATASKWVNSESEVIAYLAKIYESWSKKEPVGSTKLGEKLYNKISYSQDGKIYKDINWKSQSNDYTGQEMYTNIIDEYSIYQDIIAQLMPTESWNNKNIYEIGVGGTATDIVKERLLSIENKAQRQLILDNVKLIIDSTSEDKDLLIEKQLAELVRIKFSEMRDVLTNPINEFYYKEIKKYLDAEVSNKTKIADVNSFLKFDKATGLFSWASSGAKVLESAETLTGSQKMKSLFDLLYFGVNAFEFETTYFGNSIFSAVSTNGGAQSILDLFVGFSTNQDVLSTFDSLTSQTKINSVNIYDRLLSTFGFGINNITELSLKTGNAIELKWDGVNFETAIDTIFQKFDASSREKVNILEKNYEFNMLNSLITSSNIYNSLIFRKENTPEGVQSVEADKTKIINILDGGITSYKNIFIWSRIQKVGNDIDLYTTDFSMSPSQSKIFSDEIKTSLDILDRLVEEEAALFQINPFVNVQIVWPVLVGLIAVGMIVVSSMSLAGTQKRSKLSSKPVVKTMLIIAILISIAALGVIGGLVVPALF